MKDERMMPYASRLTHHGLLSLIGIGPGDLQQMTAAAQAALRAAETVIGYEVYIELVRPILQPGQEIVVSPIGSELERAQQAVDMAVLGRHVALISSGDIGIYAMASPVFEILRRRGWSGQEPQVEVFPGISAVQAAAARLGAPLGHDFCTISLSDLLTPWPVIERRLQAAAWGDFVVAFYNPRSQKRDWQLPRAIEILLTYRPATTPVAVVRHVTRPEEEIVLTTLGQLEPAQVDMFTLVLVGNSQSYVLANHLVTPRGYEGKAGDCPRGAPGGGDKGAEARFHPSPPAPLPPCSDIYPVTLTGMTGRQAVVVGGGAVGQRKVQGVLAAGMAVKLISPEATPQLQAWTEAGRIGWVRRPYQPGDVVGAYLVFAATNQRTVNAQIAQEAADLGLLCNVADQPAEGNFHVPAVHRRTGLVVSVSSTGESPRRAQKVRDQIAAWLGENE
jgi:cobalt-precorrin 5A hydrolase/precorrin-3B C17-methyltransferase